MLRKLKELSELAPNKLAKLIMKKQILFDRPFFLLDVQWQKQGFISVDIVGYHKTPSSV